MLEAFRDHLAKSGLVPDGTRVLVGYSGGADSTCLLHLLHRAGIDIVAAHLHHGQRGEAELELRLCEGFCQELGIPFVSGRADVPSMARDLRIGLEEAGRNARYQFLQQAAFRTECDAIATAHTRTDHVETVLMNLARGAGLHGLGGIQSRRGSVIRPLLAFTRHETRRYCDDEGLWYHDDPANEDVAFSRARVRHRVLPELRMINPAVEEAVARLAELADTEDRFLNGISAAALEQSEVPLNGALQFLTSDCEACFDRDRLSSLPAVPFGRAVRLAVEAVGGSLDFDQTQAVVHGVARQPRGSVTAAGGRVVVEWDDDTLHVRDLQPAAPFRYPLTVPGETFSDEFGWVFTAHEAPVEPAAQVRASLRAQVPTANLKGALYFRTAQAGDTMQPLGFDGRRKVSDLLAEAKLTHAARARLPIVCDLVGPLWIPGVCLDQRAKLPLGTERALHLEFGPIAGPDRHN